MYAIKKSILNTLVSYLGCISTPVASIPKYATPSHPSVVIIINRVTKACKVLSKFYYSFFQVPFMSKQSYFVTTRSSLSSSNTMIELAFEKVNSHNSEYKE